MNSSPRIRNLRARAVTVPLARPLATASGELRDAPLILIDLETNEGLTGVSYLFSPNRHAIAPLMALMENIKILIVGEEAAPFALEALLRKQFTLLGGSGIVTMAMAGVDMAAWDLMGKAAGLPLARLWGGEMKEIPAYNSTGLGLLGEAQTATQAVDLLEFGFGAIKLRLGYPTLEEDVEVTRAVRAAVGPQILLMVDFNQSLVTTEAVRRGHALDDEGLFWIEEPVRADNFSGCAVVARELKTSIQLGENFWSLQDVQKALATSACDMVMPDVMKIGGASAWLRAASFAEAADTPVSSHLFPEVSCHMLAVSHNAQFLEYVDWASPVLEQPIVIKGGNAIIPDRPGNGMAWDEAAIALNIS
jgi:mandelate racemase